MNSWLEDFARPNDVVLEHWFSRLANRLLNRTQWLIAGEPHRLLDIEFYYQSTDHADPFAHADPIQAEAGRWYFHKTYGAYRGGSFKGLDVTFGNDAARAGILIRAISTERGAIVDGPSLVVDHVLSRMNATRIANLDSRIGARRVWDRDSPLSLVDSTDLGRTILGCARVGLSLRRAHLPGRWADFLLKPYRFVSEPAKLKKGKSQMVLSLHRSKISEDDIARTLGCIPRFARRYISEYELGRASGRFEDYVGNVLSARDVCRLHGILDRCS